MPNLIWCNAMKLTTEIMWALLGIARIMITWYRSLINLICSAVRYTWSWIKDPKKHHWIAGFNMLWVNPHEDEQAEFYISTYTKNIEIARLFMWNQESSPIESSHKKYWLVKLSPSKLENFIQANRNKEAVLLPCSEWAHLQLLPKKIINPRYKKWQKLRPNNTTRLQTYSHSTKFFLKKCQSQRK